MNFLNLRFENLSFGFDSKNQILKEIDFNFPMNNIVLIRGNSTSGKSLFIRLMSGAVAPTDGKIFINDQDIHEMGYNHYSSILKHIGFGFDGSGLLVNQTLENNLALPLRYHLHMPEDQIEKRLLYLMKKFKVEKLKDQRPAFVSQNVYKIFLLLRSFVMHPEMMIFINPLTNLDDDNREIFINLVKEFRSEHGLKHVFIISDDEVVLEKLNPLKVLINEGKIMNEEQRKSA